MKQFITISSISLGNQVSIKPTRSHLLMYFKPISVLGLLESPVCMRKTVDGFGLECGCVGTENKRSNIQKNGKLLQVCLNSSRW